MTASRRKYTPSIIDQIRLAGSRVGLDLAGLFEESEDGELDFGGFVPSFTTTQTNKSRGNVLTYRPQARATSTTEFSLTPEADPSTMSQSQSQTTSVNLPGGDIVDPVTKEPEKPKYPDLTELAGKYGQSSLFGAMDYVKAKEEGYSDEDILGYLRQNPQMLHETNKPGKTTGLFEQINRGAVDTSTAVPRDWSVQNLNYTSTEGGGQAFRPAQTYQNAPGISTAFGQSSKYFGGEDLTAARQSGYSDANIKSFLEKNLDLVRGPNVPGGESEIGQLLKDLQTIAPQPVSTPSGGGGGGSSAPTSSKGTPIGFSATGSTAGSEDYFGGADIRQALSQGATIKDIQEATKAYSQQGKTRQGMAPGGEFYEAIMRGDLSFAQ